MMKNEQQVCSLELAKEMAALGFEQDSIWCWTQVPWNDEVIWEVILQRRYTTIISHREQYAAYTVAELGDILPGQTLQGVMPTSYYISIEKFVYNKNVEWRVKYRNESICDTFYFAKADTEADARAKMCIWAHKEGFI